jgi:4-hydroxy-tetrahydrodipicolinate reductase
MAPLRIAVNGAAGRMGKRLVALAATDTELQLAAAVESSAHPEIGSDAGSVAGCHPTGVLLASSLQVPVDVVVDFSVRESSVAMARICGQKRIPLVMATTGLGPAGDEIVRAAAGEIPIVWAPNMSLAVNLAMKLVEFAAAALHKQRLPVDVEIMERHHRFKEDAPSGTALEFGRIVAHWMGQTRSVHGREGRPGPRTDHEIGYHAVRAGDHPGEHTILFGMQGETLEITISATSRDAYALGALAAAKFIVGKPPGVYSMRNVLGLE